MKQDTPCWNQAQGRLGESLAKKFLERQGFNVIAERYRSPFGEIDLVAKRGQVLLFVEVKARHGDHFGDALESVTPLKLRHFRKAVLHFLMENPEYQQDYFWELAAAAVRHHGTKTEIELVKILS